MTPFRLSFPFSSSQFGCDKVIHCRNNASNKKNSISGLFNVRFYFLSSIFHFHSLILFRALQYGGFAATPVLGAVISSAFQSEENDYINRFSAPACFLAIMCCISMFFLYFYFHNSHFGEHSHVISLSVSSFSLSPSVSPYRGIVFNYVV
jgi:hypothetical protein